MAHEWLTEEQARIRAGVGSAPPQQTRFAGYAVSLLERKAERREIKSAKGRERWRYTLEHLLAGTTGEKSARRRSAPFGAEALRPTCCGTRAGFLSEGRKPSATK